MCWEDVKIGRGSSAQSSRFDLADGDITTVAGYSLTRTRLTVSYGGSSSCTVGAGNDPLAVLFSWVLTADHPNHTFTLEEWGEAITWRWWVRDGGGGCSIGVTEISIKDKP